MKRYHWYTDGMWCDDDPLPGDPYATKGKWASADEADALLAALRAELSGREKQLIATAAALTAAEQRVAEVLDEKARDFDESREIQERLELQLAHTQDELRIERAEREALATALREALDLRRALCRHSDMLDEGGDPDKWDAYCKRWSKALAIDKAADGGGG